MSTKTQISVMPSWGNYSQSNIGLYHLLDDSNKYALNFPVSIKVSTKRQNGKWNNNDLYYYCSKYCPTGRYWQVVYPLSQFGITGVTTGEVIIDYGIQAGSGSAFGKVTVNNTSGANLDIEVSVFGSAHAAMLSYSSGLIQEYIVSGTTYVGMSWTSQSTKVALIGFSEAMTPQDIKDTTYTTAIDSANNPYEGDGLGRWCRAKLTYTVNAGVSGTVKVFGIAVAADEATAATALEGVFTGYAARLVTLTSQYLINRPRLFDNADYGDLAEKTVATILYNIVYLNVDSGTTWKLVTIPSRGYLTYWYLWDSVFVILALSEIGYNHLALDLLNYPLDKSGNYVAGMPMPMPYVLWRLYENTNKVSVLSDYYESVKAYYNSCKSANAFGSYYRFTSGYNSGLDNFPLWTGSLDGSTEAADGGVKNYTVDPMILSWFLSSAYYLNKMAVVLDNGESSAWETEITNFTTLLNTLWDGTDGYYYSLIPLDEGKIQNEDFDSDVVGQAPAWWSNYGDAMTRVVATSGRTGNCLRIYSETAVDGGVSQTAFTLEDSTQYVVTFWYKADENVSNGHIVIQNQDDYGELASTHISSEKTVWTKSSFTFATPASNTSGYKLLVGLGSYGDNSAGEFLVDDIKIEKAYATILKRKTVASLFPLLYPDLDSEKSEKIRQAFYDFNSDGEVATSKQGEEYTMNTYWDGPSWVVTNFLISKGMRDNNFITEARIIEKSVDNWNGLYATPFREVNIPGTGLAGGKQFISFPSLFIPMIKASLIKRKAI